MRFLPTSHDAAAAEAVDIERIMRHGEGLELAAGNGFLDRIVLELGDLAARCADHVMVGAVVVGSFVLG